MATTMLGKITLFPYDFEPGGWMFCDGRKLFIGENDSLFALIGDAFGGDGDSFALPDLTKVAPPNCHFCIAVEGFFRETYYSGIMCETILSAEPQLRTNLKECAGQSLPKNQNFVLDQYMGNRFGGDAGNIKLPDLRSKAIPKYQYRMVVSGEVPGSLRTREPYVGELIPLPYEGTSDSLLPCDGRRLPAAQNQAL